LIILVVEGQKTSCWLFCWRSLVTMGMYALFGFGLKVPLYTGFLGF
jgi:hypothetical protein